MKKTTNFNYAKMSKEQTNEITTSVNETIATDFVAVKTFTIVDLWNIQRRSKTTSNGKKSALSF